MGQGKEESADEGNSPLLFLPVIKPLLEPSAKEEFLSCSLDRQEGEKDDEKWKEPRNIPAPGIGVPIDD